MRVSRSISYSLGSSFDGIFENSFESTSIQTDLESVPSNLPSWSKFTDGLKQSSACFKEQKDSLQNLNSDLTENSLAYGKTLHKNASEACTSSCAIVPMFLREMMIMDKGDINNEDHVCGRVSDEYGNTYTGQLEDGKPNGFGKMGFAKNGDQYEGYWKNSRPHGPGSFVRADGGDFEGEWINGKLHLVKEGVACVIDRRGNKYDGSFKNWKKHGFGTFIKVNGENYSGYYVDDSRNGYGVLTQADGSGFEGVFYNDQPTNQGHSIGRTLDNTDTISTLSVCRNNSMKYPEADEKEKVTQRNEEALINKPNRKFLKKLNPFTQYISRSKSSKTNEDLENTSKQSKESSSVTEKSSDDNTNTQTNIGSEKNTLQSIENKNKRFNLTPKKLRSKLPNRMIPNKKKTRNATRDIVCHVIDTENYAPKPGVHQYAAHKLWILILKFDNSMKIIKGHSSFLRKRIQFPP